MAINCMEHPEGGRLFLEEVMDEHENNIDEIVNGDEDTNPGTNGKPEEQELNEEEVTKAAEQVARDRYFAIFMKLLQSERFKHFVDSNFDITDRIDHEAKTIETLVIEKPIVTGPKLAPQQIMQIQAAVSGSGAKDAPKTVHRILEILGQEGNVLLATPADMPPS